MTARATGTATTDPRFVADWLAEAAGGAFLAAPGGADRIAVDSREAGPGTAFFALRGAERDGHDFVLDAAAGGCSVVVVEQRMVGAISERLAAGSNVPVVLIVDDTLVALHRVAAAHRRRLRGAVVGITGSSGKTTTRRMLDAILSRRLRGTQSPKSFNNHVGVPLTLLAAAIDDDYCLVEIGMNAPGEIAALAALAEPDGAIVTTIGSAHLGGVGSREAIAAEKAALPRAVRRGGWVVLPADDDAGAVFLAPHREAIAVAAGARAGARASGPLLRAYADPPTEERAGGPRTGPHTILSFGEHAGDLRLLRREPHGTAQRVRFEQRRISGIGDDDRTTLEFELSLPGRHMAINALAAIAATRCLGIDDDAIVEGLAALRPEAMRFEPEHLECDAPDEGKDDDGESAESVLLINDAYNANPESMAAGIATFLELTADRARRVLVLGDMLELGTAALSLHREVLAAIPKPTETAPRDGSATRSGPDDVIILIGPVMSRAGDALGERPGSSIVVMDRLDVDGVAALIGPGDAVYLKASRGVALERVATALRGRFAHATSATSTPATFTPASSTPAPSTSASSTPASSTPASSTPATSTSAWTESRPS